MKCAQWGLIMFQRVAENRKEKFSSVISLVLVMLNLLMWVEIASAQSNPVMQAFGTRAVANVRGTRVDIWSANPPSNYEFIAA